MSIFILLALVLGASASRETEVELSTLDHLEALLARGAPKPKDCCRAYTAECMACVAGITKQEFCQSRYRSAHKGREYPGCKSVLKTEVDLSALDTLEAPLAIRRGTDTGVECCLAGTCRDFSHCITGRDFSMCARNPNTSRCRLIKEMYCQRNPDSSDCTPRCCRAGITAQCLACVAGMTEEKYCAENPDFHGCKTVGMSEDYCAENPNTSRCRIMKVCARNPEYYFCTAEVDLSAVDTLEALLARIRFAHKKKPEPRLRRCCNGGRCYVCSA